MYNLCTPYKLINNYIHTAALLQSPGNTTICLGSVAELNCSSTDAQTIFYYVNNTPAVAYSSQQGITVSAPMSIGSVTLVKLIVQGTTAGVYQILCTVLLTNGSFIDSSTAYLAVQGTSICIVCYSRMSLGSTRYPYARLNEGVDGFFSFLQLKYYNLQ